MAKKLWERAKDWCSHKKKVPRAGGSVRRRTPESSCYGTKSKSVKISV